MAATATTTARRARPSLEDVCCFNVAGVEKVQGSLCWDEKSIVAKLFLPPIRFRPASAALLLNQNAPHRGLPRLLGRFFLA
jgi:hypothetical protein